MIDMIAMIPRDIRRIFAIWVPLLTAILLTARLVRKHAHVHHNLAILSPKWAVRPASIPTTDEQSPPPATLQPDQTNPQKPLQLLLDPFHNSPLLAAPDTHISLSPAGLLNPKHPSVYTSLRFGDQGAINPSVLPHPTLPDTYIMVAQELHSPTQPPAFSLGRFRELACTAAVDARGVLSCVTFPAPLEVEDTRSRGGACDAPGLEMLQINRGPHDARVAPGPDGRPLVVYGSNSGLTCFGQWVRDFAAAAPWVDEVGGRGRGLTAADLEDVGGGGGGGASSAGSRESNVFSTGTEIHRPDGATYLPVEKNYFIFWDADGHMYAHHAMHPARSLSCLSAAADGTVGRNLGPDTADHDAACMRKYLAGGLEELPRDGSAVAVVGAEDDAIHQAANSLAVTLCRRSDGGGLCRQGRDNTFIMTVVHRKRYRRFKATYEPYVVLFRQSPPFALLGISEKPLWLPGRRRVLDDVEGEERTELFYVTSLNWMRAGQGYHGYLDDVVLVGFGVEDERAAVVDMTVGDMLQGLGLCDM